MILSMTGFGKAETIFKNKNISVEIRALNSKNIDIKTRIPAVYREKEMFIRKILSDLLKRGKIDMTLSVQDMEERPKNKINPVVLRSYSEQIKKVVPDVDETQLLGAILRLPDVLQSEEEVIDDEEWQSVKNTIEIAARKLTDYRKDEGKSIEHDLLTRIENIRKGIVKVDTLDKQRLIRKKERLSDALNQLGTEVDQNRFEQELIYYLEKFDINEEKVRLNNHLDYFVSELQNPEILKGKKLGFIAQEMGREINTTGSKANDSDIQKIVVQMKDELEKIKEQVLNAL
jgi:uncharacterized protein (TIGR00255 family)